MKFKSDAQRKAVMASMNEGHTTTDSKHVPFSTTPKIKSTKIDDNFTTETWSEEKVNLALRRINAKKTTPSEIFKNNEHLDSGEGVTLSRDQSVKGHEYLMKQWKTPSGKEKEDSPFGGREHDILTNFREIKMVDFYSERGTYYVPLYRAISKDGDSMDYYITGGKVSIVG